MWSLHPAVYLAAELDAQNWREVAAQLMGTLSPLTMPNHESMPTLRETSEADEAGAAIEVRGGGAGNDMILRLKDFL